MFMFDNGGASRHQHRRTPFGATTRINLRTRFKWTMDAQWVVSLR